MLIPRSPLSFSALILGGCKEAQTPQPGKLPTFFQSGDSLKLATAYFKQGR